MKKLKTFKLMIICLLGLAVGKYLNNRFELSSGAASFLEDLYDYNELVGLAFYILSTAILLFIMYKLYKLLTIKTDIE